METLRLYKKYDKDPWQLFDLKSDPREEKDLANKYPELVQQLAAKHADWAKTLAPLGKIPELNASNISTQKVMAGHSRIRTNSGTRNG